MAQMTITLYQYNGDPRTVDKQLGSGGVTKNMWLGNEVDILHPTISIDYSDDRVKNTNYAYIPNWGRYYFVTGMSSDKAGKLWLNLSIDVLNTYKDGIKNAYGCVVRWEGAGINWQTDDKLPIYDTMNDKKIYNLTGGTGFPKLTTQNHILIGLI